MTASAGSSPAAHYWKLMKLAASLFRRGFNPSKCKTAAKMAVARIKLLRNKREMVVKQMRRDIAMLLQSGQDATARIRVEHVLREQNILAANEVIELFCELVVARVTIMAKQRECPADLEEGIASLIFAAPRCAEIPELLAIRNMFEKKYGKDFVSAATDLRPNCGVNRLLIDKLSVKTPSGEVKLKVMKEIAKEHQIEWDTTESEKELLKPPEQLIEGPRAFVSASRLPAKPADPALSHSIDTRNRSRMSENGDPMHFEDMASAAEAAAQSAKMAIAAAQAAAYLANKNNNQFTQTTGFGKNPNASRTNYGLGNFPGNSAGEFLATDPSVNPQHMETRAPGRIYDSHSFDRSRCPSNEEMRPNNDLDRKVPRRYSYNAPSVHSDIKFDESDCDEDIEVEEGAPRRFSLPPERSPPPVHFSQVKQAPVHRVHPKLPDYDDLAAHFEALKHHRART
ncbi:hypothetical protein SLA2020_135170 [Shorea laevis]